MTNEQNQNEAAVGRPDLEGVVSLASLREMFYRHQNETGHLPERIHLTKAQRQMLAAEAAELGMVYQSSDGAPDSVWGMKIVASDHGPHLAG